MAINDLLSWNGSVRQYPKGKSPWCLHLRGINCQSDGQRARMSVVTGMSKCTGIAFEITHTRYNESLENLAEVLMGKGLNTVILKGDMMGGTIENRDCVPLSHLKHCWL